MQKARTNRSNSTRGGNTGNKERAKLQRRLHPREVSGRSRGRRSSGSSRSSSRPHFLNPIIKPVKLTIVKDRSFFDQDRFPQDKVEFAISNLYHTLCCTGKFEDKKEWKELPPLAELADYLTKQAEEIIGDYHYEYDQNGVLRMSQYQEIKNLCYTHQVPMEWIPLLEYRIKSPLHSLLIDVLAMIHKVWNLDLIYNQWNDMIISSPEDYYTGDEDEDFLLKATCMKYLKGGPVFDFIHMLRARASNATEEKIRKELRAIRPKKGLEKKIYDWIKLGVNAFADAQSVSLYFFPDATKDFDMDGVKVDDMYSFVWSFHDKVAHHVDGWYENNVNSGGFEVGPMQRIEYFPDRKPQITPSAEPVTRLAKFLDAGRKIYFDHFDDNLDSYYRKQSDMKTLIEILT